MLKFSNRIDFKILIISFVIATILLAIITSYFFTELTSPRSLVALENYSPPLPTRILDINGEVISEFYTQKRELVDLEDVPSSLINALLSIEDDYFFFHLGFNPIRIIKAIFRTIFGKIEGGSTLTQQLCKQVFLSSEKTITRKVKELWYALKVEALYGKKEILYFYLNQVYLGHGCYGIKSAASFYFNKKLNDLTLIESTLLVAMLKGPERYSPLKNLSKTSQRHAIVLELLVKKGIISASQMKKEYHHFWRLFAAQVRSKQSSINNQIISKAPYFTEYIRKKLENGKILTKKQIYEGGLEIYTSLNLKHQVSAQKYLWQKLKSQNQYNKYNLSHKKKMIERKIFDQLGNWDILLGLNQNLDQKITFNSIKNRFIEELKWELLSFHLLTGNERAFDANLVEIKDSFHLNEKVEGALISIDPKTGYVTAMVGGSGFNYNNQINRALQSKRQVGSLLKPFIYAAAIDKKLVTAGNIVRDEPLKFGSYLPKNYSGKFKGEVTVRDALRKSINIPAVATLDLIGISDARKYLATIFRSYNLKDQIEKFPEDLTLALGTGIFSPIDIATAYAVIANEGEEVIPITIRYVKNKEGKVLFNIEQSYINKDRKQIIDKGTAFIIRDILKDVFQPGGTASQSPGLRGFNHYNTSSGKTGTTSNWKDVWFAGFNPYLTTVIWIGYDSNKSLGKKRTGGLLAAPIWVNYNKEILNKKSVKKWTKPDNVTMARISRKSGLRVSAYTKNKDQYTEYFLKGTEPKEFSKYEEKQQDKIENVIDKIKIAKTNVVDIFDFNQANE